MPHDVRGPRHDRPEPSIVHNQYIKAITAPFSVRSLRLLRCCPQMLPTPDATHTCRWVAPLARGVATGRRPHRNRGDAKNLLLVVFVKSILSLVTRRPRMGVSSLGYKKFFRRVRSFTAARPMKDEKRNYYYCRRMGWKRSVAFKDGSGGSGT